MQQLPAGAQVGGYRIVSIIGRGGMGVVYLAEHASLERQVALKVLAPELTADTRFRARFERESRTAASLDHPNVVPIYEAGEGDGVLFIAMRYVAGPDLRTVIDQEGHLEPARALGIIAQVASALDAAHARGLIHRDVKPGNILLAPGLGADGGEHVYLTDFGLTKRSASTTGLTQLGQMVGTIDYIAPEQLGGKTVDSRADIYALGCVLFELLTGKTPYARDSDLATLAAHLYDLPPKPSEALPELGTRFDDVIARAMAKEPNDRYPRASALAVEARGRLPTAADFGQAGLGQPPVAARDSDDADGAGQETVLAPAIPLAPAIVLPTPDASATVSTPPPRGAAIPSQDDARIYLHPGTELPSQSARRARPFILIGAAVLALLLMAGAAYAFLFGGNRPGASPAPGATIPLVAGVSPSAIPTLVLETPQPATPQAVTAPPSTQSILPPTPTPSPTQTPTPTPTPTTPPVGGPPQLADGTWAVSNTLESVSGDPINRLGDHGRRYELTFVCPPDAECRLSVVTFDTETGERLGRITYRWEDEAYVFSGGIAYYRDDGGSDCMSSDTLIPDAYTTREDVRFVPAGSDGGNVVFLTGSKSITGTPTDVGVAADCAPYELRYSAQMTFQGP